MRPFSHSSQAVTYSKIGLMVLREQFEQRQIDATFSSFRSMVPLSTPSGSQNVESELEAELLEQLAFSLHVYDLLTQPIIEYAVDGKRRQYAADIAVQLHASGDDDACRYIVEVKRRADVVANGDKYAIKFEAGRLAAENMGAAFRIMDESRIRTPYLQNARLLRRHLAADPETVAPDVMLREIGYAPIAVTEAIALLRSHGIAEPDARASIEQSVAWRLILCDLTRPFTDATAIRAREPGSFPLRDDDPILGLLHDADSE